MSKRRAEDIQYFLFNQLMFRIGLSTFAKQDWLHLLRGEKANIGLSTFANLSCNV
jgi:hypothetical protein